MNAKCMRAITRVSALVAHWRPVPYADPASHGMPRIENMTVALSEAGATLADVISTRVLVASSHQADLATAWNIVREAFADHEPPSTLIGVAALGYDGQLVEIEAVAATVDI